MSKTESLVQGSLPVQRLRLKSLSLLLSSAVTMESFSQAKQEELTRCYSSAWGADLGTMSAACQVESLALA